MRALLSWSAAIVAVLVGLWAGGVGLGGLGLFVGIALQMIRCRRPRMGLGYALAGLCLVRGLAAGDPGSWRAPRRGGGLRTLEIVGASTPGPQCRVRVRDPGGGPVALALVPPELCPLAAGAHIRVLARGLEPVEQRVPGDWNAAWTARRVDAALVLRVDHAWRSRSSTDPFARWVAGARQGAWALSRADDRLGFLAASSLGARAALAPDRRDDLRAAGLGHLVAVSGLHVGMAAVAVLALCLRASTLLVGSAWPGVVVSSLPVLLFVILTGAAPPAMRAAVMAFIAGLGILLGRPVNGRMLLFATGALLVLGRPAWILDAGFQLSMAAMAAVVSRPRGTGVVGSSWRVAWAIAPFSLWHFGDAVLAGVLANCVAIPVFSLWVLPLALVGWLLVPLVGSAALEPAAWGAGLILDLARGMAHLPAVPGWLAVAAGVAVLGLEVRRRVVLTPRLGVVAAGAVLGAGALAGRPEPGTLYVVGTARAHSWARVDVDGVLRVAPGSEGDWRALARAEGTALAGPRDGAGLAPLDTARVLARCRGRPRQRVAVRVDPGWGLHCYRDGLWLPAGRLGWTP